MGRLDISNTEKNIIDTVCGARQQCSKTKEQQYPFSIVYGD